MKKSLRNLIWNTVSEETTQYLYHNLQRQLQLLGHRCVLQASVTLESPIHSFPPFNAFTFCSLVLILVPPPHSTEQRSCSHSPHSQSTETNSMFMSFWTFRWLFELKNVVFQFDHSNLDNLEYCISPLLQKAPCNLFHHWLRLFLSILNWFASHLHILCYILPFSTRPIHNLLKR